MKMGMETRSPSGFPFLYPGAGIHGKMPIIKTTRQLQTMRIKTVLAVKKIIFAWVAVIVISTHASIIFAEDAHHHHGHGMMHDAPTPEQLRQYTGRGNAVVSLSENGLYRFSLYSSESPVPIKTIHDWILHIETIDGTPVENAKVFVFGGMPMHQHGFPTKPRAKEYLGNGDYRVEGIKFNMPGYWEMRFNIKHNNQRDRVVFRIHLGY